MPIPRPKRTHAVTEEAIAQRRAHIVAAAAGIIATAGFEGCSFAAVSDDTGFSIGMIQHHFRTRERLLLATVEYRINASVQEWRDIHSTGNNAVERLHDFLIFAVDGKTSFAEAWGFWIEVYGAAHKDADIRAHVAHALLAWREILVETLKEAEAEGLIDPFYDAESLATLLLAVVDGLAIQAMNGLYDHNPKTMIQTLRRFAAHELGIDEAELLQKDSRKSAVA